MQFLFSKRLLLSCLYLGALLGIAGTLFYALQGFQGTLFLQRGMAESLAFRPSVKSAALGVAQRNVPRDLLLLDNPRVASVLRRDQHYDGMVLPFSLRLDDVEILTQRAPRHWLEVTDPETSRRTGIQSGTTINHSDDIIRINEIGPWAGLIRGGLGQAMAALSVSADNNASTVFLEPGQWRLLAPDRAVGFFWHADAQALAAARLHALDTIDAARWGVRDGKAIQWMDNFTPGTTLRLRDGQRVTLKDDRRKSGTVTLEVSGPDGPEWVDVSVNSGDPDAAYLLEDPAATGCAVALHAWREDQFLAQVLTPEGAEEHHLAPGASFPLPGSTDKVHVLQIMDHAVAVPAGEVFAIRGELNGEALTLREGLTSTYGTLRLRYEREHRPPEARYQVAVLQPTGEVHDEVFLDETGTERIGSWLVSLSDENPFAPNGIAVSVVRRPGGLAQFLGLGLFVAGCFGLILTRFGVTWRR